MVSKPRRCQVWVKQNIENFLKLAETSPNCFLSLVLVLEKVWAGYWDYQRVISKKKKIWNFFGLEIKVWPRAAQGGPSWPQDRFGLENQSVSCLGEKKYRKTWRNLWNFTKLFFKFSFGGRKSLGRSRRLSREYSPKKKIGIFLVLGMDSSLPQTPPNHPPRSPPQVRNFAKKSGCRYLVKQIGGSNLESSETLPNCFLCSGLVPGRVSAYSYDD